MHNHVSKKKLTEHELNQLQILLYWYYDRKKKEQQDIASIPGIKPDGYKDNIDDYIDVNLLGKIRDQKREKLQSLVASSQNPTKSLIEMFSAWIIERVLIFKKDPRLQNIRVISTTLSDDFFS